MMVNNRYRKRDPFFVKKAVVQITISVCSFSNNR